MNSVQVSQGGGGGGGHSKGGKDSEFEDIVISSAEKRNWRGICIALLVISAVLSVIVLSIFILSPEIEDTRTYGRRLQLADIYEEALKWKRFNGSWINDKEFIFRNLENGISVFNVETFETKLLMDNSSFRRLNVDCFNISPDLNFILLYECEPHGSNGTKYAVFEIFSSTSFSLALNESANDEIQLQKVLWSPELLVSSSNAAISSSLTNNKNNKALPSSRSKATEKSKLSQAIAFIHDYDIYYKPKVHSDVVIRLTSNGKKDSILNGIPDWLYSNTPDLSGDTLAFSTNGGYLSFLSFNISHVQKYDYTWNGKNSQYPQIKSIRYPRYNTPNPIVTCFVVNLNVLKFTNIMPLLLPQYLDNDGEFYVTNMFWISNEELTLTFTTREQTMSTSVLCRAPDFKCMEIQREVNDEIGVEIIPQRPIFLDINEHASKLNGDSAKSKLNSNRFLIKIHPVLDGKFGSFRQIALIPLTGKKPIGLTIGRNEVTELIGWDDLDQSLYFMSAPEGRPGQRHLYKLNLEFELFESTLSEVNVRPRTPVCLTCDNSIATYDVNNTLDFDSFIRRDEYNRDNEKDIFVHVNKFIRKRAERTLEDLIPNNCLYNRVHMSSQFSYFVLECLGPDTPSVYLVDSSLAKKIFILNDGNEMAELLSEIAMPQIKTFSVEIKNGFHAQVRLFLPPVVNEEEDEIYPLILHIDSTPGTQLVSEEYSLDWNYFLASNKHFIVAQIDGRGSGFQGEAFESKIKGNVSLIDVEDQLTVITYLRDNFKVIDTQKICAYGWGYGAYLTSMLLTKDSEPIFNCYVAVAPIVSFQYYNSYFTEKYFGYHRMFGHSLQEADLSLQASNFLSKNYLLIHGTADTLVHQQHTMLLTKSLIQKGVIFRHQVYTDEDHQLKGVICHVHKTIESFLDDNFGSLDTNKDAWEDPVFALFANRD